MKDTSRSGLFAQNTLGHAPERIQASLRDLRIVIGIPEDLAGMRLGQVGLVTATNILCRLGALAPNLDLDVPSTARVLPGIPLLPTGEPLGEALLALIQRLAMPQADVLKRCRVDRALRYDVGLFVGAATVQTSHPVTVGAKRWLAAVRTDGQAEQVHVTDGNPLGMILAAALGSAEVVKRMWLPLRSSSVVIEPIERRIEMSAYDLTVDPKKPPNPKMPSTCKLGHACLFGLGATGSGCMFILGCLPNVRMSLDLVDMDSIEASNEERLFSGTDPRTDVGQAKASHAQRFIQRIHKGVTAFAYMSRFQDYVDAARDRLGYVLCGLDDAAARRELQLELPSVIANGGTDGSRWMFSRHDSELPDKACLIDLYPQSQDSAFDADRELAKLFQMAPLEMRRLLRGGHRAGPNRLSGLLKCARSPAQRRVLSALLAGNYDQAVAHVCSTMRPNKAMPAATISFVSVLPAVAMVADLVKRRVFGWQPSASDPNVFQLDTLRLPTRGRGLKVLAGKHCECQSKPYRKAFATRQSLRRRHLNRVFTRPAKLQPITKPASVPRALAHPRVRRLAQYVPPAPALVVGGAAVVYRVQAVLLWLMAGATYMASLGAAVFLIGLFVRHEGDAQGLWQPWRAISLAWHATPKPATWVTYLGIALVPPALCLTGMSISVSMVKTGVARYMRTLVPPGHGRRLLRPDALALVYAITSLPVIWLGALPFVAFSVKSGAPFFGFLPCSFCLLFPLVILPVLGFFYISAAPFVAAAALCEDVFTPAPL